MKKNMSQEKSGELLRFTPFVSCVDPSFWHKLSILKLEVDKLEENEHKIWGYYSNKKQDGLNQILTIDASSFNEQPDAGRLFCCGKIINKNTIESYKEDDKKERLKQQGISFLEILKTSAMEQPALLNMFTIISFADLKQYNFHYRFLYIAPAFISYNVVGEKKLLKDVYSKNQIDHFCDEYNKMGLFDKEFFLVKVSQGDLNIVTVKNGLSQIKNNSDWMFGFSDSCDLENPGWPLRNFLAFISYHCNEIINETLSVICLRLYLINGKWEAENSIILNVRINSGENTWEKAASAEDWVGWERNSKGFVTSKIANLRTFLDPLKLAESSVDLNLKLMKWQVLPDLNLDIIKATKCLLLGAGTLGCAVARNLLSWGVKKITFVDYGNVSYSNPVRQSLYKFKDTGLPKAKVAAASLKEIYPNVETKAVVFCIPMPGHPVGDSFMSETEKNVQLLEKLIEEHDVTFLLMDSRESRWLPTLIAASKEKLVINAALGFDTFLVMRHGLKNPNETEGPNETKIIMGYDLGCYFCNDVTAPGNSSKSRTLDQQCTVTRPGVSHIAGALAVELLISLLQHPLQGLAPAESDISSRGSSLLGIVPHSIRGFLSHYQVVLPATEAFTSCVACSKKVILEYKKNGTNFVLKVVQSSEYLEELCGLLELRDECIMSEVLEYSDSECEN